MKKLSKLLLLPLASLALVGCGGSSVMSTSVSLPSGGTAVAEQEKGTVASRAINAVMNTVEFGNGDQINLALKYDVEGKVATVNQSSYVTTAVTVNFDASGEIDVGLYAPTEHSYIVSAARLAFKDFAIGAGVNVKVSYQGGSQSVNVSAGLRNLSLTVDYVYDKAGTSNLYITLPSATINSIADSMKSIMKDVMSDMQGSAAGMDTQIDSMVSQFKSILTENSKSYLPVSSAVGLAGNNLPQVISQLLSGDLIKGFSSYLTQAINQIGGVNNLGLILGSFKTASMKDYSDANNTRFSLAVEITKKDIESFGADMSNIDVLNAGLMVVVSDENPYHALSLEKAVIKVAFKNEMVYVGASLELEITYTGFAPIAESELSVYQAHNFMNVLNSIESLFSGF